MGTILTSQATVVHVSYEGQAGPTNPSLLRPSSASIAFIHCLVAFSKPAVHTALRTFNCESTFRTEIPASQNNK